MLEISKEEFMRYEAVRRSNVTNMFMVSIVSKLARLTKEQIEEIMLRYGELREKYMGD